MELLNIASELVLSILGVVVLAVVLVRLGRRIALFLLAAGGIAAVIVVGLAIFNQAAATRQTARAATVASAGQTVASVGVVVLATLLVVVLIAGFLVVAYLVWRLRRMERRMEHRAGPWRSGPNALWGRSGQTQAPAQPYTPYLPPPPAYPAYPPQAGYTSPPAVYPGYAPPPQVVMIYGEQDGLEEEPLDLLPLWDDENEGW